MAGKGKKKRNSKDSTASNGSGGDKKKGGGKSKKKTGSGKSTKFQGDIFNEGAMENAYFVCHNVQVYRGHWYIYNFVNITFCYRMY